MWWVFYMGKSDKFYLCGREYGRFKKLVFMNLRENKNIRFLIVLFVKCLYDGIYV